MYSQRFCGRDQSGDNVILTTATCKPEVNALYPYECTNGVELECQGWSIYVRLYSDELCTQEESVSRFRKRECVEVFGGFHKLYCMEYGVHVQECDPLQDLFVFPYECTDGRTTDCNIETGLLDIKYYKDPLCENFDYNQTYLLEP